MADIESVRLPDNSTFNIKDPTALHDTDIVDDLTSSDATKVLSANQGRVLKGNIDDNFSGQSNINFLINPFFTVNQRGQASYTTIYAGTADSWKILTNDTTVAVSSNGITLSRSNVGTASLRQVLENTFVHGKTVTVSVKLQNGTILHGTDVFPSTNTTVDLNLSEDVSVRIGISSSNETYYQLQSSTGNAINVRAAKLELGSVSTLANDVEPNQTLETLACQKADFSQIAYQNLDETTARKAYSAGQYFFNADGELCRAKVAISSGQTLTEGTNFEKKTVGEELAGESGAWTSYTVNGGNYTAGFTSQEHYYARVGGFVLLHGSLVLTGNADESHRYTAFINLPFLAKNSGATHNQIGIAKVQENGKSCVPCNLYNKSQLVLHFIYADGTYVQAGQHYDYQIMYEC